MCPASGCRSRSRRPAPLLAARRFGFAQPRDLQAPDDPRPAELPLGSRRFPGRLAERRAHGVRLGARVPHGGCVHRSRRALALAVQVRRYRKVALHVLAVQIWLFTFPPPLYSIKTCLTHPKRRQKVCDTPSIASKSDMYPRSVLSEVRCGASRKISWSRAAWWTCSWRSCRSCVFLLP